MSPLKLVFMGTAEFAVPSLKILLDSGYAIRAVVTGADKPRGRGQRISPTPVKAFALQHDLQVLQPVSVKDPNFVSKLAGLSPDLAVVVAFRILPRSVFTIPRLGTFNLHASLLPKYRGAAPINWAIINGEQETGVSTFFLEEAVDTGTIILQDRLPIGPDEDAGSLHDRLATLGADTVLQTVRLIERGDVVPTPQNADQATPAPKIFREHCRIDWNRPAGAVHDFIRGLSPHPAAWTTHRGGMLKIYKTVLDSAASGGKPGSITIRSETLTVATADSALSLIELQQEGHRRIPVAEFLRGYRCTDGDVLT